MQRYGLVLDEFGGMRFIPPKADGCYYEAEEVDARIAAYESALQEAEAILGGEYDVQYGPFSELVEKARSL